MNDGVRRQRWAAAALIIFTLLFITLIVGGFLDPKPIGRFDASLPLNSIILPAKSEKLIWLDKPLPEPPYTLRLTAVYEEGELDSGYGLAVGSNVDYLAVAVSPLGYLSIWQTGANAVVLLPWQAWPHVNAGAQPNEIWLDIRENGEAAIRVNRELLWVDELTAPAGSFGLWGQSFGETAVINFQTYELYTNP